tara:strand:+ start:2424 stop:2642 length:219 start_codon:yes stop_codon:yes gene_type:complete
MQTALIAVSVLLLISYAIIGIIVGWLVRENIYSYKGYMHPEMFDENGNVLPDQIFAVRFENTYDDNETEEDD